MIDKKLNRLMRRSKSRMPLFGKGRRLRAIRKLAEYPISGAVAPLVEALRDKDARVREAALAGLRSLSDSVRIDKLCDLALMDKGEELKALVVECAYIASEPLTVRIATALLNGRIELAAQGGEAGVDALIGYLDDPKFSRGAGQALSRLTDLAAVDALCERYLQRRDIRLETIIKQRKYVATKPLEVRIATALLNDRIDLAAKCGKDSIDPLIGYLGDAKFGRGAEQALSQLTKRAAIDALCKRYLHRRDIRLETIIKQCRYVATQPLKVRLATALLNESYELLISEATNDFAPLLIEFGKDRKFGQRVLELMAAAARADGAQLLQATLAHALQADHLGVLAAMLDRGLEASDPALQATALFATKRFEQFDRYDPDLTFLMEAWSQADEGRRALIHAALEASGNPKYLVLYEQERRADGRLGMRLENTEEQLKLRLDLYAEKRQHAKLLGVFKFAPYAFAVQAVEIMTAAGFKPTGAAETRLLERLTEALAAVKKLSAGGLTAVHDPTGAASAVWRYFDAPEYAKLSEAKLKELLASEDPAQKAKGLYLLNKRAPQQAAPLIAEQAASEHWLLRSLSAVPRFFGDSELEAHKKVDWSRLPELPTIIWERELFVAQLVRIIPTHDAKCLAISETVKDFIVNNADLSPTVRDLALAMWRIPRLLIEYNSDLGGVEEVTAEDVDELRDAFIFDIED